MFIHGNIVRLKCGFWGEPDPYLTGRLGVIEYSYGEIYGTGECYGGYKVADIETGESSAWWDEDYLEFISDGSDEEVKKAKRIEINRAIKEREESIKHRRSSGGEVLTEIEKIAMRDIRYLEKNDSKRRLRYDEKIR